MTYSKNDDHEPLDTICDKYVFQNEIIPQFTATTANRQFISPTTPITSCENEIEEYRFKTNKIINGKDENEENKIKTIQVIFYMHFFFKINFL